MKSVNPDINMPLRNKKRHPLILFLVVCSVTFFASGADIFESFLPRRVAMSFNQKLIFLHGCSDIVLFLACIVLGVMLYKLYHILHDRVFPFSQYAYWFAGLLFFSGITHFMSFLNLLVSYYWLDGIAKLIAAWFASLLCLALVREYPNMKLIKTPKEIAAMTQKLHELQMEIKALREGKG